jgi:REP element-mobilizing transposase RayT
LQVLKQNIKFNSTYYLTLTVVNWIDVFTRKNHRDAIIESLKYCQAEKGLNIYAYVIMSNHIHLIVNCNLPFELSDVIRDFKKFISKKIVQQIQTEPESRREWMLELFSKEASDRHKNFKFWQSGNNAIELYNEKFTWDKVNYINDNPVRSGLVKNQEDWVYSSASNYHGKKSILSVEIISAPLNYGIKKW